MTHAVRGGQLQAVANTQAIIIDGNLQQFDLAPVSLLDKQSGSAGIFSDQLKVVNLPASTSHVIASSGNGGIVLPAATTQMQVAGMKPSHTESASYVLGRNYSSGGEPGGVVGQSNLPGSVSGFKAEEGVTDQADLTAVKSETATETVEQDDEPVINIVINNVVCSFAVRCHLNLRKLALEGANVIYRREQGMVSMKIRKPHTTASIWSSGKMTVTGATSEEQSLTAARKFSRIVQKLGYNTRLANFRVVNVLGTCSFPFGIRITHFSRAHPRVASYEPEIHPGVTYKIPSPKATLKIFSTGSITITAPRVQNIQAAIEHIYPLVYEFRMVETEVDPQEVQRLQMLQNPSHHRGLKQRKRSKLLLPDSEEEFGESSDDDSYESDRSDV